MPSASPVLTATRPSVGRIRLPSLRGLVITLLFSIPVITTVIGAPYYMLGHGGRVRAALHPLLRPSGTVGLAFGIVGFALFLFMWLYPLRKAVRWLAWTGTVGAWMNVHIVAGLLIPLVVAVHAAWRFDGLIGLGYFSMVLVSLSGIVGRYLYTHIPRSKSGVEMNAHDVAGERRALVTRIAAATRLDPLEVERALATDARPYQGLSLLGTLRRLIADDITRRKAIRALKARWQAQALNTHGVSRATLREVLQLARREIALNQQARALGATQRVFGFWHVAHRPFAITAFIAVGIHVVVAIAIGVVRAF